MRDEVVERLTQVNREFYQSFAGAFSETRGRVQPGVRRVMKTIPPEASVLDLGCGNGMVGFELYRHGHRGTYLGIDSSNSLLEIARRRLEGTPARFLQADLTSTRWHEGGDEIFHRVIAFAVLHHVPGERARQRLLQQIRSHMTAEAQLIVSTWDVFSSERLRRKHVPWERIGLAPEDVDHGDCLIDWRHGGHGIRYVHSFDETELAASAASAGYEVTDTFRSDGQGGRMSIYQFWTPMSPQRSG